jgi:hypothetical protein
MRVPEEWPGESVGFLACGLLFSGLLAFPTPRRLGEACVEDGGEVKSDDRPPDARLVADDFLAPANASRLSGEGVRMARCDCRRVRRRPGYGS